MTQTAGWLRKANCNCFHAEKIEENLRKITQGACRTTLYSVDAFELRSTHTALVFSADSIETAT